MCVGPTNRDAFNDRNKYGVKRARILFTERYNCQKNKRSQSLFAHVFLHHLHQRGDGYSSYSVSRGFSSLPPPSPSPLHPSYIPHSVCPRLLLSPLSLWLPALSFITYTLLTIPSYSRCLLPSVSFPFSSTPNHRRNPRGKAHSSPRVNEFAITIFHVDVTTYSLVDFGKTRCVLVRVRSAPASAVTLVPHRDAAPQDFL